MYHLIYSPKNISAPKNTFIRFLWSSEQTPIISLHSINRFPFVIKTNNVFMR